MSYLFARLAALAVALFLMGLVVVPAFAQMPAAALVAPSSIWFDLWSILQPVIVLLISTVGPVLVGWIAARLINFLKVSDEQQRLAIEAQLRDALHLSAVNALKFALTKAGGAGVASAIVTPAMLSDAAAYVAAKNPQALYQLGVGSEALNDIILSKVPDVLGVGAKLQP